MAVFRVDYLFAEEVFMKVLLGLAAFLLLLTHPNFAGQNPQTLLATGLKHPEAVAAGNDGKIYVALVGETGKEGEGSIAVIDKKGNASSLVSGLDHPAGIFVQQGGFQGVIYLVDKKGLWRIDTKGTKDLLVKADAFPTPPHKLTNLTADAKGGSLYVTDAGDKDGKGAAVFKVVVGGGGFKGGKKTEPKATVVTDQKRWPELSRPAGIVMDGQNHLLIVDSGTGKLHRIHLADGSTELVAEGLGQPSGLVWDRNGRLFISDKKAGRVMVIGKPGNAAVQFANGFQQVGDIGFDPATKSVLVPDSKAGTVTALAVRVPGADVDETPLPIEGVAAFSKLKWTDWKSETPTGKQVKLRPIVLTHAGDGTNRIFVATQQGVIHVFPNDPQAEKTHVFLNIQKKVIYSDGTNEEGFLGLAFHPQFKKNGQFFVFYTLQHAAMNKSKGINIVSRFQVSKDNPNQADPNSEEEIIRFERPDWNHDGGTICFGPDGYLYLTTGDGGSANDPLKNGQNLNSLLAKVLRIDVDRKEDGKNYAIPKDNPFVGRKDARPEVWAYGLRNIWRMAFDKKTGTLWAGDVGQDLYEEVDIIVKGGNYGWSVREALHPFSAKGVGPRKDLIDPIWEYHHSIGVCIIGGCVYRGPRLPELDGAYIYANYPSGAIWALRYDDKAKRVVANRPLRTTNLEILSFGEDEQGEVYFLVPSTSGRGIYQLQRQSGGKGDQ
jgi:glucose/arabinose dehydrogenase